MAGDREDRDTDDYTVSGRASEGRLGGYAAAYDERMIAAERADVGAAALSGIWAGAVSGVVMGLALMVIYAVLGVGFWLPMKIISIPILGPAALTGGVIPVVVGAIVHIIVASLLGMLFGFLVAALIGRVTVTTAAAGGVLYGLIIWITAQFIILPIVFPLVAAILLPWPFGLAHAVYGAVLGLLPAAYNR